MKSSAQVTGNLRNCKLSRLGSSAVAWRVSTQELESWPLKLVVFLSLASSKMGLNVHGELLDDIQTKQHACCSNVNSGEHVWKSC